jgi:hypothetical protein
MTLYYVLGPGTHSFGATAAASQTGSYTFSSTLNPALPTGCVDFLVTNNISVDHALDGTCTYAKQNSTTTASRKYVMYVPANQRLRVNLNSTAFDPYLECYDVTTSYASPAFISGCSNDDFSGLNSQLDIPQAASGRWILIRATNLSAATASGAYTLSISSTP